MKLVRRPAATLYGTQLVGRIEIPARVISRQLARQVRQNHDREFESLRLVDRHQADAVAALLENRRLGTFRIRRGSQLVDESAKRNTTAGLVLPRQFRDV